jgi:hypothetical protein
MGTDGKIYGILNTYINSYYRTALPPGLLSTFWKKIVLPFSGLKSKQNK